MLSRCSLWLSCAEIAKFCQCTVNAFAQFVVPSARSRILINPQQASNSAARLHTPALLCFTIPVVYVGSLKIMLGTGSLSGSGLDHSNLAARQVGIASTLASVLLRMLCSSNRIVMKSICQCRALECMPLHVQVIYTGCYYMKMANSIVRSPMLHCHRSRALKSL